MPQNHRTLIASIVVGLALVSAASAQPNSPNSAHARYFDGLWEGIDSIDGSQVQFSISDIDGDGEFRVLLREDSFFTCLSAMNTQGRGLFIGTGVLAGRNVLQVEAQRLCINDDGSPAPPEDVEFEMFAKRRSGILFSPQEVGSGIILHRVSAGR